MDRKYKHRGYQDNGWEERRDRDWERDRDRERGGGFLDDAPARSSRDPRERTGRKPTEPDQRDHVFRCQLCGNAVPSPDDVAMDDQCPNCEADLWCCRSCLFFDPQARFECKKDIPKRIKKKAKKNQCELFKPRMVLDTSGRSKAGGGLFGSRGGDDVSRKAFDALFGDDD